MTLDRYILRQMTARYGSVLVVVLALMVVEHLPKLLDAVQLAGAKAHIIVWTVIGLLPEYLGIGLLFGLYLSIGLALRGLALHSELDAIRAMGVSTFRLMRIPIMVACITALMLVATQGWLRPMGETVIRQMGLDMRAGAFGLLLKPGSPIVLGGQSTLMFDRADRQSGDARGIIIVRPNATISARSGTMHQTKEGELAVLLSSGRTMMRDKKGFWHGGDFERLITTLDVSGVDAIPKLAASAGVDAQTFGQLARSHDVKAKPAIIARLLWAWFALLIPAFALTFSIPPRRGTSAVGLFAGVILIVLFIRSASALQAGATSHPFVGGVTLGSVWSLLAVLALLGTEKLGEGYLDTWLLRFANGARDLWQRRGIPQHLTSRLETSG